MPLRSKPAARNWRWSARLRSLFKLSASWANYEDLRPAHGQTLTWVQPEGRTRAVLLTQKEPVFRRIAPGLAELSITTCLVPYPTPSLKACETILRVGRVLGAPLFWFGDLDPIGFTAFEVLHSVAGVRKDLVSYVGIDDRWLSILESERGKQVRWLEQQVLTMGQEEREHFGRVSDVAKSIRIGDRCLALLTSGKKLEVEGLMTVSPSMMRRVPGLILQRIEQLRRHPSPSLT